MDPSSTPNPVVLMRPPGRDRTEWDAAAEFFPVYRYRAEVPAGSLVIGRYAFLPLFHEVEQDLLLLGSRTINSYAQHAFIASMDYYEVLRDVTFPTWFRLEDVPPSLHSRAFVVKGRTNSQKLQWSRRMFAANFEQAVHIGAELLSDGLIGSQGLAIRLYEPLQTLEVGLQGLPLSNEWRVFYYRGQRLTHGYYWGTISDWGLVEAQREEFETAGLAFADSVAGRIAQQAPFVVLDVAKTQAGGWRLVELNDGCQAGLNDTVDATELYAKLREALAR